MGLIEANLICLACVVIDQLTRAVRLRAFVRGMGFRFGLRQAMGLNLFEEAAAAVTPMRLGGEPARLAGMLRAGIPGSAGFVALLIEVVSSWPIFVLLGTALAVLYAPDWWQLAGPRLARTFREAWPWVIGIAVLSIALWIMVKRYAPRAAHRVRRPLRRARVHWRRMPRSAVVLSVPLSILHFGARVAILPVLASTLANPPPMGPLVLASFAMLYSQMVLPTPSGAGAVELVFLGGAAGDLGRDGPLLLVLWRFYTLFVVVGLGMLVAVRMYGGGTVRMVLRTVFRRQAPAGHADPDSAG